MNINLKRILAATMLVLAGAALTGLEGCTSDLGEDYPRKDWASVYFTAHPQDGQGLMDLSCTFDVTTNSYTSRTDGKLDEYLTGSKTFTVYWMSENGVRSTESHACNWDDNKEITTSITTELAVAESETFLDGTFWVQVTWVDDYGDHLKESAKAVCTVW